MFKFLSLLVVAFFVNAANGSAVAPHKEFEGFRYLGRIESREMGVMAKDYYLSYQTGSHYDGEIHCRQTFGGQLAIVLTEQQNTDLRMWTQLPANRISCAHIGGIRQSSGAEWFWQSGSTNIPIRTFFWQAGQPSSSNNCLCVHGVGPAFGWHTCSCDASLGYSYICEL